LTFTNVLEDAEQEFISVPVTVYIVVDVGSAETVEPVEVIKPVVGDHE
jgi:hypothetical protein